MEAFSDAMLMDALKRTQNDYAYDNQPTETLLQYVGIPSYSPQRWRVSLHLESSDTDVNLPYTFIVPSETSPPQETTNYRDVNMAIASNSFLTTDSGSANLIFANRYSIEFPVFFETTKIEQEFISHERAPVEHPDNKQFFIVAGFRDIFYLIEGWTLIYLPGSLNINY